MARKDRPAVPREKIIRVNNTKKIDFSSPYKFIYTDWWFNILVAVPFLLAWIAAFFIAFFVYRMKIIGRENLKILKKKGCITISNHCHYFDTVFANFVVLPRALHTSVAQRNFEVPVVRHILRIYRAFPIPAKLKGLEMVSPAIGEALKKKHHVHFLPEGDLVFRSQTIHRFKLGAFILSYQHQSPVVPITYVLKPQKPGESLETAKKIRFIMVIGEPLYPPPLTADGSIPEAELEKIADETAAWMEKTISAYHKE